MYLLLALTAVMLSAGTETELPPILDSSIPSDCPQGQTMLEDECVNIPKLLKQKPPVYPELARRAHVQTTVELMATLQPDGTVGDVEVTKSCGMPKFGFDEAAIKAVKKWRYEPVIHHGEPVAVRFRVKVAYYLTGAGT